MMINVRCNKCGQHMNYEPRGELIGKKKRCVYCGKTFTITRETISKIVQK